MREISTDLNVLLTAAEWSRASNTMPATLASAGYLVRTIHADIIDLTCEPDNMLVNQFSQYEGRPPIAEQLHRVVINGRSALSLADATKAVISALPPGTYWYGTSLEGDTEPGGAAACAWQQP